MSDFDEIIRPIRDLLEYEETRKDLVMILTEVVMVVFLLCGLGWLAYLCCRSG